MSNLSIILKKEFIQISRDPAILRLIFLMPIIQLLILPFAADYEIKNINIAIVDQDHSDYSRELIGKFQHSNYFRLTGYETSYKNALKLIEADKADIIVEIPNNFEKTLVREDEATISLVANAVNGTKGNLGAFYAQRIVQEFNSKIRSEWIQFPRVNPIPLINVEYINRYNKRSDYQTFMVPGILAVLITMIGSFLTALNIVKEKEIGTIEQLNVSPIKKWEFILGKLIPFWVLGMIILTIGLVISYIVHGITPGSNLWILYVFTAFYLLAILGIGLLISNFSQTQQQAMMVSFFFTLIFILMSGLYTPVESMPFWAQKVAWMNPVTYLVDVMRMVLLKGAQFADVLGHLKIITLAGVALNVLAIWSYSKRN